MKREHFFQDLQKVAPRKTGVVALAPFPNYVTR
jgi:hypothetical protein